ncbi:hypothetical protein INR49_012778 [Caranx melampygus]|nr:hypothetical protein INR49_012778 [Caranx melampygus]
MSVTLKQEEVTIDTWGLLANGNRPKIGWITQRPVWWIGAAAVCLVLLLLSVILGLVVQNGHMFSQWNKLHDDLMESQKLVCNLTKDIDMLQSQYNAMAAHRNELEEEVRRLNQSTAETDCHHGWVRFNSSCYYASARGETKTWRESRQDCLARRSDLVIITTNDEQNFLTTLTNNRAWIGLSDIEEEGKWKWVDETELVGGGFWRPGEPNNEGHEDCAEISHSNGKWNDVPCNLRKSWICEY